MRWSSVPSRGSSNIPSYFITTETGVKDRPGGPSGSNADFTFLIECLKTIFFLLTFFVVDFVIRFITMALKSMVVVQHRKIIPFRRRVSS